MVAPPCGRRARSPIASMMEPGAYVWLAAAHGRAAASLRARSKDCVAREVVEGVASLASLADWAFLVAEAP
jgi:hypothetical protein